MNEWSKQIPGAPDSELGITRDSPITYHCTSRGDESNGLIFLIHGFGDDVDNAYDKVLRRYIAETSGLLVVTVEYHCYRTRPDSGARRQLTPETFERVCYFAAKFGMPPPGPQDNVSALLHQIGHATREIIYLEGSLIPPNGDYQNFGVIQAMDHLYALNDIIDSGNGFDENRIFVAGSSHGGYLAHLIARLAPNSILGVLDNSSYTLASPRFFGQGTEYSEDFENLKVLYNVATKWHFINPTALTYFGPSRALFRDTGYFEHLHAASNAAERKCQFVMFNTVSDKLSPIGFKRHQLRSLSRAGFTASLDEITEDDTGKGLFKSMEHADAPMQKLFPYAFPRFTDGKTTLDRFRSTEIAFNCVERTYRVVHSPAAPYVELRIEDNPDY
jgi:pimeloyl-ACP methyl ester carboxylesterase